VRVADSLRNKNKVRHNAAEQLFERERHERVFHGSIEPGSQLKITEGRKNEKQERILDNQEMYLTVHAGNER